MVLVAGNQNDGSIFAAAGTRVASDLSAFSDVDTFDDTEVPWVQDQIVEIKKNILLPTGIRASAHREIAGWSS